MLNFAITMRRRATREFRSGRADLFILPSFLPYGLIVFAVLPPPPPKCEKSRRGESVSRFYGFMGIAAGLLSRRRRKHRHASEHYLTF